jgi:hypothetical protein
MNMNSLPPHTEAASVSLDVQADGSPEMYSPISTPPPVELNSQRIIPNIPPALQRSLGRVADEMITHYAPNGNVNGSRMAHDSFI